MVSPPPAAARSSASANTDDLALAPRIEALAQEDRSVDRLARGRATGSSRAAVRLDRLQLAARSAAAHAEGIAGHRGRRQQSAHCRGSRRGWSRLWPTAAANAA